MQGPPKAQCPRAPQGLNSALGVVLRNLNNIAWEESAQYQDKLSTRQSSPCPSVVSLHNLPCQANPSRSNADCFPALVSLTVSSDVTYHSSIYCYSEEKNGVKYIPLVFFVGLSAPCIDSRTIFLQSYWSIYNFLIGSAIFRLGSPLRSSLIQ